MLTNAVGHSDVAFIGNDPTRKKNKKPTHDWTKGADVIPLLLKHSILNKNQMCFLKRTRKYISHADTDIRPPLQCVEPQPKQEQNFPNFSLFVL